MTEFFLDTSYAIALSSPADKHHEQALILARQIESDRHIRLVTTRAVLLEIGNALARQKYRAMAVQLLKALENDPSVEIMPLSESLYAEAARCSKCAATKSGADRLCIVRHHAGARDHGRVDRRRTLSAGRLPRAAADIAGS